MTEKKFKKFRKIPVVIEAYQTDVEMEIDIRRMGKKIKGVARMNDKYTYEVTDTGKYYYENNVRIFPEQFWHIIKKLEYENKELKKELALSKPLYSRRQLEKENEQLKKEVEMLMNGLKAYDETLPLYLDCEDIMHFNNKLYEFEMERMDFYKKYPNRIHYKGDVE